MKITRRPPPLDFGASNDDGRAARRGPAAPAEAAVAPPRTPEPIPEPQVTAPTQPQAHVEVREAVAVAAPNAPPAAAAEPSGWLVWLAAFAVAVLWALGPIAFAVGYRSKVAPLQDDHFAMMVFALLAIGPAALVFGAAFFVRQSQKLSAATRRAQDVEASLLSPALRAAVQAGEVTRAVREEIAAATTAADAARDSLGALRQAIAAEAENLLQASQTSLSAAQQLSGELGRERGELEALARSLDSQAARAAEVVAQQADRVVAVSQGAEAQLREAERVLAERTAGIAAAAGDAGHAARTAGEDLARQIARLETAGAGVADQVRAIESGLGEQRNALITLAQALRGDHEGFAAETEAHAARLDSFIAQARRAAGEMSERAADTGQTLRALIGEASERFAELSTVARLEREAYGDTATQAFDDLAQAAADQRARLEAENRAAVETLGRAAEETRQAAARHAAAAREQIDQLSEAAFAAGQKANQVFEARLEEARALIEQSTKMVGEAGAAAARRLDEGAVAARTAMGELSAMLDALQARAHDLPAEARGQAEAVRAAVAESMDALMASARRTAEEAHAIDEAFQERVRRNFDLLGEAVRLMGAAAAAPPAAPADAGPAPIIAPDAAAGFAQPYAPPVLQPAARAASADREPPPPAEPAGGSALAERLGLRPRLKLTPTAADEALSAVFDPPPTARPAPPPPVAADDADEEEPAETWTWKDLLASLGGSEEATETDEGVLAAELGKMGVEPEKLLPEPRIDQIAAAMQAGDIDGARQVVKRLAGAHSRRIVRRLFTDEGLKATAVEFVRRYQGMVDDAAVRDPEGFLMASLLGSEAGRVYLLLDQALGDAA